MEEHLKKAYQVFISEIPALRASLEQLQGSELNKLERSELHIICHRLRGGAAFFSLGNLANVASELEAQVVNGTGEVIKERLLELLKEIRKVETI